MLIKKESQFMDLLYLHSPDECDDICRYVTCLSSTVPVDQSPVCYLHLPGECDDTDKTKNEFEGDESHLYCDNHDIDVEDVGLPQEEVENTNEYRQQQEERDYWWRHSLR